MNVALLSIGLNNQATFRPPDEIPLVACRSHRIETPFTQEVEELGFLERN
jgi:hypothetical protein